MTMAEEAKGGAIMEMKTPYYIMKIYDKNNCVVETEEADDYDYICETFA